LRAIADAGAPARRGVERRDRLFVEENAPAHARQIAGQKLHQRRLADAVAAEHAQRFAGDRRAGKIAHDRGRAIAAGEVFKPEAWAAHFSPPT
jgi:hypothetical protein